MSRYELAPVPHIVAGQGSREALGELAALLAGPKGKALLVADPGLEATGMIDEIRAVLGKTLGAVEVFSAFFGDPTIAQTDAAASLARESGDASSSRSAAARRSTSARPSPPSRAKAAPRSSMNWASAIFPEIACP